jgi:hypothetical protein
MSASLAAKMFCFLDAAVFEKGEKIFAGRSLVKI